MALTMLVIGLMACGFSTYADAQDGVKFGMGIELQNQLANYLMEQSGNGLMEIDATGRDLFLTPTFLFTIQLTPSVFIEPSIGYHRFGHQNVETSSSTPATSQTDKYSGSDLQFGAGMIYALKPDAVVSPILHPVLAIHMLKGTHEQTGTTSPLGNHKNEGSATAFQLGLGVGGLVNLKETVYLTIEARLMITKVGDITQKKPTDPNFKDLTDDSGSIFNTDMVIGLRYTF
jgi:hypothetical protein